MCAIKWNLTEDFFFFAGYRENEIFYEAWAIIYL